MLSDSCSLSLWWRLVCRVEKAGPESKGSGPGERMGRNLGKMEKGERRTKIWWHFICATWLGPSQTPFLRARSVTRKIIMCWEGGLAGRVGDSVSNSLLSCFFIVLFYHESSRRRGSSDLWPVLLYPLHICLLKNIQPCECRKLYASTPVFSSDEWVVYFSPHFYSLHPSPGV